MGWYRGNSSVPLPLVGQLEPNGWGLYDMHGNVWEWCEDTWVGSYTDAVHLLKDGLGEQPDGGAYRVVRGGAFGLDARDVRSALRHWNNPGHRNNNVGFRPAQGIHS